MCVTKESDDCMNYFCDNEYGTERMQHVLSIKMAPCCQEAVVSRTSEELIMSQTGCSCARIQLCTHSATIKDSL